jgi:hypothetical protein
VVQYSVNVVIQASGPIPQATYEATAGALRPDDEAMCIWVDEVDNTRLLVSTDVPAGDVETALKLGRALSVETLTLFGMDARVDEVLAETEEDLEQYAVWKPDRP